MNYQYFRAKFFYNNDKSRNIFEYYMRVPVPEGQHLTNDDYIKGRHDIVAKVQQLCGNATSTEYSITFIGSDSTTHSVGDNYVDRVQFTGDRYNKAYIARRRRYGG